MTILKAIEERRSIRQYTQREVPQDMIIQILQAGTWAPSVGNSQPWQFHVLRGEYTKRISALFYEWAKDYIPNAQYIPPEKKPLMLEYAKDFGGAPNHIAVSYSISQDPIKDEEALMAASAAIENICLAASGLGLGTVWIAGHLTHNPETSKTLGLSQDQRLAGIIPIGYPATTPPAPPRIPVGEKLTWLGW